MSKSNASGIVLLLCIVFITLFGFVDIFRTEGFQFTRLMLPMMILIMIFTKLYGIFWINLKGKGFWFADGIKGTVIQGPVGLDNDRIKYYVAVCSSYVSPEREKNRMRGISWFADKTSATVTLEIVDRSHKFTNIPDKNCGDPSGCIKYFGSVNGIPIEDEQKILMDEIGQSRNMVVRLNTIIKSLDNEVSQLSQAENKVTATVAQRLKSMVRDLKGTTQIVGAYGQPPKGDGF